jgi:threonine/homoserine/homoserine lactone efflux protein
VTSVLVSYLATCIAIELTPGPNMAYLAVLSAERGKIAGLFAVAGVALGLALLGALATFGVGELIVGQPWLYESLRWAGIVYLIYLAYDAWADARRPVEAFDPSQIGWRSFRRGLVTNLLNPKAALFYITVVPSFIVAGQAALPQSALLGAIFVAVATAIHVVVVLLAGSLRLLLTQAASRRALGAIFAALLLVVVVWVGVTTHRQ